MQHARFAGEPDQCQGADRQPDLRPARPRDPAGGLGRTITWTSYNKPASITQSTRTISFVDDTEHQRSKQVTPGSEALHLGVRGLGRGHQSRHEPKLGKFGPSAGKPVGMQTADQKTGFRVEYDAHLNVLSGKEKGTFTFEGDQSMVDQIVKQFLKE